MKIYGYDGESMQVIDDFKDENLQMKSLPIYNYNSDIIGYKKPILMKYERPRDGDYIASSNGDWVVDIEKKKQNIVNKINELLDAAYKKISILQYAVDENMATDEEVEEIKAWKKYCVLLNRIERQTGFPDKVIFPESPAGDLL